MENVSKSHTVTLRDFRDGDEAAFREINLAWISRFFKVEPTDEAAFSDPKHKFLDSGGRIFFAEVDGEPAGCIAMLPMGEGEFELAKMGVKDEFQGLGLGRKLLSHCIETAQAIGAKRLYLESNSSLKPALHLYETLGFQHIPKERLTPSPYARADVFMEMLL